MHSKKAFILLVSSLLLFGFLFTTLASYLVSLRALRTDITEQNLPLTSDNVYSEIQRDLLRPVFISSLMASDTFLRDWVLAGETDTSRITRFLKEIQVRFNTFTCFFVSENTRRYYYSGGILKTVRPDEVRDAWYFRVRNMKSEYEINVDPDMAHKDTMTVFINYRVFDYQGRFIGATGVGLNVHAVKSLIENYQKRYRRNIFFADSNGLVALCAGGHPYEGRSIDKIPGLSNTATALLSKPSGTYEYIRDGDRSHVNARFIPEFNWYLVIEQSETTAVSDIRTALFVNFLVCLVITAVVIIMVNLTISLYQKRLEHMAVTDKLTGLKNRHSFDIIFEQALKDARRRKENLAFIMLDIDHFKSVNDNYGHQAGDAALKALSGILTARLRESDMVFRWGGEEFAVVLPGCGLENALAMAETVRTAAASTTVEWHGRGFTITVSQGVTLYKSGEPADSLLSRADNLMYDAKNLGRNRVMAG